MKKIFILIFCTTMVFAYNDPFDPNEYKQRDIHAVRIQTPLKVDGRLEEELYRGPSATDFIQYEPFNGARASQKTELWIGYDDNAIYVGARMWDTQPDSIVGRVGRRDAFLNADIFEIIIDSYHDKRTGFSFQINPAGSIRDEVYFNDSWTDDSWDGIWEGKTAIDDQGWTAEMRIPYSQLRFTDKEEYTWGILPTRYIQRAGEWDYFCYFPLNESGLMSRTADLTNIRNIHPPQRREILPYVTTGFAELPSQQANVFVEGQKSNFDLGADVKFGIGANLTVDATINPDFGQVEVDPASINLSDRETYYSEKRPFFLEGSSIFNFGNSGPTNNMNINFSTPRFFYSRRIGRSPQGWVSTHPDSIDRPEATRILGAAKISGKAGDDWSIGGLTAITNREYAHYYADGELITEQVEPYTSYNLIRSQKEIKNGRYGLGFMGTYTKRFMDGIDLFGALDDQHNSTSILNENGLGFGVDGWAFLGKDRDYAFGGWVGFTNVNGSVDRIFSLQQNPSHYFQRPDADHVELDSTATSLSGHAGRVSLNKENGNVSFNAALGWISPGFESNDLGITWTTDVINKHIGVGYRWTERGKYIHSARSDVIYATNHDFDRVKTADVVFGMANIRFVNFWSINFDGGYAGEVLSNTALRGGPRVIESAGTFFSAGINTDRRKDLSLYTSISLGSETDGGHDYGLSAELNAKIGSRLNLTFGPNMYKSTDMTQYVRRVKDAANTTMYGNRYVFAQIDYTEVGAEIRVDYPITPRFTLQGYFQPFMGIGEYQGFKEYAAPESDEFLVYGENGSTIEELTDTNGQTYYVVDPTGGSDEDSFNIYDPNFNQKSLVGTLVLRWEFSPGSALYFVWTHNGYNGDNPGSFKLKRDFNDLLASDADDVFALKLSYWFGG
ncbi:MAG: carbohydrate binding family 9 domain-containing protein [Candidatus Marinimicrobia bacterium]|nr:carbohydrate binding family 9 domain-containing protein [Candidatus Neomarinimicrobiota bacterium]MCF7851225.1 carbohydrate binding family 9 domain-containing protein [Candidatus Neomarinimicrobiota bacterium]MCF7905389.1 carbohydrate binding family 9 domain-containing protein [Candidatus Neomarinimicrobiota bacterium]